MWFSRITFNGTKEEALYFMSKCNGFVTPDLYYDGGNYISESEVGRNLNEMVVIYCADK